MTEFWAVVGEYDATVYHIVRQAPTQWCPSAPGTWMMEVTVFFENGNHTPYTLFEETTFPLFTTEEAANADAEERRVRSREARARLYRTP